MEYYVIRSIDKRGLFIENCKNFLKSCQIMSPVLAVHLFI